MIGVVHTGRGFIYTTMHTLTCGSYVRADADESHTMRGEITEAEAQRLLDRSPSVTRVCRKCCPPLTEKDPKKRWKDKS